MALTIRNNLQNPFTVYLYSGKIVTNTKSDIVAKPVDRTPSYNRKIVEGDSCITVLPQLKIIREPRKSTSSTTQLPLKNDVSYPIKSVVSGSAGSGNALSNPTSGFENTEVKVKTRTASRSRLGRRHIRKDRASETTTTPRRHKQTNMQSADYIEAMLHRPNYTAHERLGSPAFRTMAKEHILNMNNRGVCSPEFCKAYRGTQEVEFDSSTDCKDKCIA